MTIKEQLLRFSYFLRSIVSCGSLSRRPRSLNFSGETDSRRKRLRLVPSGEKESGRQAAAARIRERKEALDGPIWTDQRRAGRPRRKENPRDVDWTARVSRSSVSRGLLELTERVTKVNEDGAPGPSMEPNREASENLSLVTKFKNSNGAPSRRHQITF